MGHKKNGKPTKAIEKLLKKKGGICLDIGCGENKQHGFVGLDIQKMEGVDIVQDLEKFPWPLPKESVQLAVASHVLEHINPAKFGFINFMNEVWRILKPGARLMISVPYAGSQGYWQDPTHVNPINEITWCYFDPEDPSNFWRFYKPKPWRVVPGTLSWQVHGFLEVVLEKRADDKKYYGKK